MYKLLLYQNTVVMYEIWFYDQPTDYDLKLFTYGWDGTDNMHTFRIQYV